jgi:hypothetical protein
VCVSYRRLRPQAVARGDDVLLSPLAGDRDEVCLTLAAPVALGAGGVRDHHGGLGRGNLVVRGRVVIQFMDGTADEPKTGEVLGIPFVP